MPRRLETVIEHFVQNRAIHLSWERVETATRSALKHPENTNRSIRACLVGLSFVPRNERRDRENRMEMFRNVAKKERKIERKKEKRKKRVREHCSSGFDFHGNFENPPLEHRVRDGEPVAVAEKKKRKEP